MTERRLGGAAAVDGEGRVPGDKSISHRALILGALIRGRSYVGNLSPAADVAATARALQDCGGSVRPFGDGRVSLDGAGAGLSLRSPDGPLDCANSGTTMRLLSGALAGHDVIATLDGDQSLRTRPMERVAAPLRAMGAEVTTLSGHAPLVVRGTAAPLGVEHHLEVASAQVKSAILLAGLNAQGPTVVHEPLPTRDHTERLLRACAADLTSDGVSVTLRPARLEPFGLRVPGDISSAAFFMALAAARPRWRGRCSGIGLNPGRTGILDVLERMGTRVGILNKRRIAGELIGDVEIAAQPLVATRIEAAEVPRLVDELPLVALLGAFARGSTEVTGAEELRAKESDRIETLTEGLRAIGVRIEERPDGFAVRGVPSRPRGGTIDAAGDHRIAMLGAIAGAVSREGVRLEGAESVAISFPGFFDLLANLAQSGEIG